MKDLKFRAYHKPTKQLFDVTMIDFINAQITVKGQNAFIKTYYWLNDCVLMQYTGLKDCTKFNELTQEEQENWLEHNTQDYWKGRDIYIGDILSFDFSANYFNPDYSKPVYVVEFFKGIFPCARGIHNDLHAHWHRLPFTKVLGNIHQNKQLLKEINK